MPKRRTIMVTGAGGSLAKRVMYELGERHDIIAVDFRSTVRVKGAVASYMVDLMKRGFEDVFRNHPIDGIIHLGRIQANELNRNRRYNSNVLGTHRMLDLATKYDVGQILILSSHYVYGAHPYNPAMIDEEAPLKASGLTLDLVDSVELENLASVYMWKRPELNITVLRPTNIIGPGVKNTMSRLLTSRVAPVLLGFSPIMQFLHVDDVASAIVLAFENNHPGIYNVAPDDWIPYHEALEMAGAPMLRLPSVPSALTIRMSKLLRLKSFPAYLIDFFKYPVVLDGKKFRETFGWTPEHSLADIFAHYQELRERRGHTHMG